VVFAALDNLVIPVRAGICASARGMRGVRCMRKDLDSGLRSQEGSISGQSSGKLVSQSAQFVTMAVPRKPLKSHKFTLQNLMETLLIEKTSRR
jgi:hypothetical protein